MVNDHRIDNGSRDRLTSIHNDYLRFARRTAITLAIQTLVLIVSLSLTGFLIKENHDRATAVKKIAVRADRRAEQILIRTELSREKICSENSNKVVACRALFNRLSASISNAQRHDLACAVLHELRGPGARSLRRETCPIH